MKDPWKRSRVVIVNHDMVIVGRRNGEAFAMLTFCEGSQRYYCSEHKWAGCRHTEAAWVVRKEALRIGLRPPFVAEKV